MVSAMPAVFALSQLIIWRRSLAKANMFVQIQGVSVVCFSIIVGLAMRYMRRYKVNHLQNVQQ
jgi:hypothetical protein